ncbi:hypothetical protein Tco_0719395 [Tanacetum coccineum]
MSYVMDVCIDRIQGGRVMEVALLCGGDDMVVVGWGFYGMGFYLVTNMGDGGACGHRITTTGLFFLVSFASLLFLRPLRNFFEQRIAAMKGYRGGRDEVEKLWCDVAKLGTSMEVLEVDLTGDKDPTDEDGETRIGDLTGVLVFLGDEISLEGKKS